MEILYTETMEVTLLKQNTQTDTNISYGTQ